MKCERCGSDMVAAKLTTTDGVKETTGYVCEKCLQDAFNLATTISVTKPKTQMEMFNALAPHHYAQFMKPEPDLADPRKNGAIALVHTVHVLPFKYKTPPGRFMHAAFYDRKQRAAITHATFSCS